MKVYRACYICGLKYDTSPYHPKTLQPMQEYPCPCCNFRYGVDDFHVVEVSPNLPKLSTWQFASSEHRAVISRFRLQWLDSGAQWHNSNSQPELFDHKTQMTNIPPEFMDACTREYLRIKK